MSALVWIRRDIRLEDHHALAKATSENDEVSLVFIFDSLILNKLKNKDDRRITFIHESLLDLSNALKEYNSDINILYGDPTELIPDFVKKKKIKKLYFNRDYEPYAKKRDLKVANKLKDIETSVFACKDSVYFESPEIKTNNDGIYKVFTPYKNKWLEQFSKSKFTLHKTNYKSLSKSKVTNSIQQFDWFKKINFVKSENVLKGGRSEALGHLKSFQKKMDNYNTDRDFPAIDGTSNISPYIRHGCISIRELIKNSRRNPTKGKDIWLSELIWRDFYQMILDSFPHVAKSSFKPEYDQIKWVNDKKLYKAWCEGNTGFPIVDSAMRCLNQTGMMHNRLRMVVASFLCKLLHIDWKWGEKYFAEKLLDFDLAANNGGWQWSSSSGCDSQPYFRIFNPYSQSEKFDKNGDYIKKFCPELEGFSKKLIHDPSKADLVQQSEAKCIIGTDYPAPIIDYKSSREYTLDTLYSVVKKS